MQSISFTRRFLIAGAGATIASAALAVPYVSAAQNRVPATPGREDAPDPLMTVIAEYRSGLVEFNLNAPGDDNAAFDAYAEKTFRPAFDLLSNWTQPATTLASAVEALRCAYQEERDCGSSDIVMPLLTAAFEYFEKHPVA